MTEGNLRDEYCPARVYQSTIPNQGHVRKLSFSDEYSIIGKPQSPNKPVLAEVEDWKPIGLTIILVLFLIVPAINILAIFGLMGLWIQAVANELPKYEEAKKRASLNYQRKLENYEIELDNYKKVLLPQWKASRQSQILEQKAQENKIAIDEVWRQKSWKVHSQEEIQSTRIKGYIGQGEDSLVNALVRTQEIYTFHQVEIEPYYIADIVCLSLRTGKLCVVEVDGSQHWLKSEQIERDNRRMALLADKGIPTIRFINSFAARSPDECVCHIHKLLS